MSLPQLKPDPDHLIDDIVRDLSTIGELPREALNVATDNWELVFPAFLDLLEGYVRDPVAGDAPSDALFLIMHLFGQQRETRAYRPLMRLLSMDSIYVEPVLGDAVTETLPRIAINVFDGDPAPMQAVIENAAADEFVRSGLLRALAYLAKDGRIDFDETRSYLLRCYDELRPQRTNFVWVAWQSAISYLGLGEFKSLVKRVFARGWVGSFVMDYSHFEQDLARSLSGGEELHDPDGELRPFGTVEDEIGHWHCFTEAYREQLNRPPRPDGTAKGLGWLEPYVNTLRNVGRNDPCPCGSGKKFKKCCLDRGVAATG